MVNEFCGFKHGVIGTDKMPADTTLNNMKKADLIKLLHTAQHNYESLMWFYNNAVKANMSQLNNNGWIPCSERLPEDGVDVLVWFEYFRHGDYNRLFQTIGISFTYNGDWSGFVNGSSGWSQLRVIAWQPLPNPYIPKQEEQKG